MQLPLALGLICSFVACASAFTFERINKNDSMLLVVDHQLGLFQLVRDFGPEEYRNNILAHAAIAKVFNLPTILTTSAETGPNGPLPKEILEMHPDAPFIKRQGEVNAWDNADFRAAVKATGKNQVIMAGIVTDVCTTFLALSLVQEGYTVFANADASGTFNHCIPGPCQRSLLTSVDIRGPPWIPFGEARRRQVSQIVLTSADAPLTSVDPASTNAADVPLHTTRLRQSSPTLTASGAAIADQNSCHGIY